MPEDNFLLNILEADPQGLRGIFQQFGIGQGRSTQENKFGQTLFQPFFNQFLGGITKEISETGRASEGNTFRNFLGQNFDFNREFLKGSGSGFSNSNVLGRGSTQFDFGQSRPQGFGGFGF